MIHEDERRILEDWPEVKTITAKQTCILGNHYHKIKTEKFILISGSASLMVNTKIYSMEKGKLYIIEPNQKHKFILTIGSVLIGLCSHAYDPTDDYRD